MRPTERFRRQHRELQQLAKTLTTVAVTPGADSREIRRHLATFAGKLRVHAAMETEALYPELLASTDAEVKGRAQRLFDEVGGLYDHFDGFIAQWDDPAAIDARRIRFRIELLRTLAILGRRMIKENRELYPMIDRAVSGD
jgi:iron-sulfur cluster repair protein YtfE (RIC family)